MSTYKQIAGTTVKAYTTNPSDPQEGEMWYNQTTLKLRGVTATAAWSSAANAVNPPRIFAAGDGPPTAGWVAGGGSSAPSDISATEEFNGSGWTSGTALPGARYGAAGVGSQTAALIFNGNNGSILSSALEYDGSTWASPSTVPSGSQYANRAGTQTAALAFGGANPGPTTINFTAEYNGSTWTTSGNMATGVEYGAGTGTETAALCAGGYIQGPASQNISQEYNGSTWTLGNPINTSRFNFNGFGIQTAAVIAGGFAPSLPGATTETETYDGTTFTTSSATMATAKNGATGMGQNSGPGSAGWVCGEDLDTEEYNFSAQVIVPGAWASSGNTNDSRRALASVGSQTAGLAFGGRTSPTASPPAGYVAKTEQYDGTSWTEVNDLNNARSNIGGAGTQTAAVAFGGLNPALGPRPATNTETWDGTNWTSGTASPTGSENYGACGTSTAALRYGGLDSPVGVTDSTLEFDGTNFTTGGDMNTARNLIQGSAGSQTAGLAFGGTGPNNQTEEYNGSTWTSVNNLNNANYYNSSASSPQTDALGFGSSPGTSVEQYNGTSWFTAPNLGTQRADGTGFGTTANGSVMVNGPSGPTTYPSATEEFTPESTSANSVDITTAE